MGNIWKMGRTWTNRLHLEEWVNLGKWVMLKKVGVAWKGVKIRKIVHKLVKPDKRVTIRKYDLHVQ